MENIFKVQFENFFLEVNRKVNDTLLVHSAIFTPLHIEPVLLKRVQELLSSVSTMVPLLVLETEDSFLNPYEKIRFKVRRNLFFSFYES